MEQTTLHGFWTWDGTNRITVFPDVFTGQTEVTNQVQPGDFIGVSPKGPWFEIESIIPDAAVFIRNPTGFSIPIGSFVKVIKFVTNRGRKPCTDCGLFYNEEEGWRCRRCGAPFCSKCGQVHYDGKRPCSSCIKLYATDFTEEV
jgi:hypothetical protein